MNLWLRLIWLLLSSRFHGRITSTLQTADVDLMVLPTDCDFNFHMTNGRYASIADLGRMDLALRSGLGKTIVRNGWAPIVSCTSTLYRRELRVWRRFRLSTRIRFWNDRVQVFEHTFRFRTGKDAGKVAAVSLSAAAFYDRKAKAFIPMDRLFEAAGTHEQSPLATPEITAFLEQIATLKTAVDTAP